MKKEKLLLIGQIIILVLLIITFGLWFFNATRDKGVGSLTLIILVIMLAIIAIMIPILLKNYKSVKENLPIADERSKKAGYKAGYYSFLISIYLLLAIGWFGDDYFQRPSQATGAAILGLAVIFIVLLLYFENKGKL